LLAYIKYELGFENNFFENRGIIFYKITTEIIHNHSLEGNNLYKHICDSFLAGKLAWV
jgi:hypothetical protein